MYISYVYAVNTSVSFVPFALAAAAVLAVVVVVVAFVMIAVFHLTFSTLWSPLIFL